MPSDERSELRDSVLEGRYRVGACIGVGGTGIVFETTRLVDRASLVVKTLRPTFAHNPDLIRRVHREAEVTRRVHHPGLVPILDVGHLTDGSPYLVMRRMGAESLKRYLRRRGTLEVAEVAVIVQRVAAILHLVHQAGYVHRDIKPEHVLLDRGPEGNLSVSLLDFGVCASDTADEEEKERERGRVFGTPCYVSPEQASGDPYVDGRADIFGLGITMFEMLTGCVPFHGSTVTHLLRRIIREDAPRVGLIAPTVDLRMDTLVAQCLARPRDARPYGARALARALAPFVGDRAAVEGRLAASLQVADDASDHMVTVPNSIAAA